MFTKLSLFDLYLKKSNKDWYIWTCSNLISLIKSEIYADRGLIRNNMRSQGKLNYRVNLKIPGSTQDNANNIRESELYLSYSKWLQIDLNKKIMNRNGDLDKKRNVKTIIITG